VAAPRATAVAPQDAAGTLTAGERAAQQASAVAVADQLMAAYARPTLTPAAWLAGISGYLTTQTAAAYQYTDPAQVPVSAITGAGTAQEDADYISNATVVVPTNIGPYTVQLTRPDVSASWRVNVIVDPGGNS